MRNIVHVEKRDITVIFCVKRDPDHSYSSPILDTPIETSLSTVNTPLLHKIYDPLPCYPQFPE